jgi:arylsulfatase A-like enzyme
LARPNVLLIVMDTARRDAFTPYGAVPDATPSTAQLASRGTAIGGAVAAANWTMPSHVSMLTGLLPRTAGLSHPPGGRNEHIAAVLEGHRDRYLPFALRSAGYRTLGVSANVWISRRNGFGLGFDEFVDVSDRRVRRMHDRRVKERAKWYVQALQARLDDGLAAIEQRIAAWLDERDERPWFMFANLIECHSPYLPPKPYSDVGPLQRVLAARDASRYQTMKGVWRICSTGDIPPARTLGRMRHLYGRAIRMMDDFVGRILERLDRAGVLDETLVIVTSDHGENFGEGGFIGHAASLADRLIGVPVVLAGPGAQSVDGVWSQARLPALVGRAAGVDGPWTDDDGPAVSQYDTGIERSTIDEFRAWGASGDGIRRFFEPGTCATDGRYKLVTLGEDESLFDLTRDPLELSPIDIASVGADVVAPLRRALRAAASEEWTPAVGASEDVVDAEKRELEERMRLLGYM